MATLWLYVLSGEELGRIETFPADSVLIGRGEDVDLQLRSKAVSRHHARVELDSRGQVWVEDLKSTSGTFLEGGRVQRARIASGAILRIADVELRLRLEEDEGARAAGDGVEEELQLEGDWEEGVAPVSKPSAQFAPVPAPARTKKPQPSAKDLRRAEQVGGLGKQIPAQDNSKTLQYSTHQAEHGFGGGDLNQRPVWQRLVVILLGLALLAGIAYGTFQLTQGVRGARGASQEEPG